MRYRYIIYSPPYIHSSGGVRALYILAEELRKAGYEAYNLVYRNLENLTSWELNSNDIVVYPEVITGNPLNAKRVVRFLGNKPGLLGGLENNDKSEVTFAFCPNFSQYSDGKVLTIPIIEDFFKNNYEERYIASAFWVGKARHFESKGIPFSRVDESKWIEITRSFPESRKDLAEFLNSVKTFYTYDNFTALMTEALKCGCNVKIIKDGEFIDYRKEDDPYDTWIKNWNNQFDMFIMITQNRDTWGEAVSVSKLFEMFDVNYVLNSTED